jgi:hypothetical protein
MHFLPESSPSRKPGVIANRICRLLRKVYILSTLERTEKKDGIPMGAPPFWVQI